jgi:hypothetical protein
MDVASNTGVRVLCTVVNGSCSNLQSAVVSRVVACVRKSIDPEFHHHSCYRVIQLLRIA